MSDLVNPRSPVAPVDPRRIGAPTLGDRLMHEGASYAVIFTFRSKDRAGAEGGVVIAGPWEDVAGPMMCFALPNVVFDTESMCWIVQRGSGLVLLSNPDGPPA